MAPAHPAPRKDAANDTTGDLIREPEGWSKQELIEAAGISAKTFDTIRKAARVKGPTHGGLSWVFGSDELIALVKKAEGGRFTERGLPAARAWRALLLERGIRIEADLPLGRPRRC